MDDNQLSDSAYEAKVKDDWERWWRDNGAMVKRGVGELALVLFVGVSLFLMVAYLR